MEKQNEKLFKSTMTSGAILGVGLILYSVIVYVFNAATKPGVSVISYAIILAGIIYGTKNYRDNVLNGTIKYSTALGVGTLIAIFAGIISGLYNYIFVSYIDPGYFDKIVEQTIITYQEQGYTDEQIEGIIAMSNAMRKPILFAATSIFGSAIIGFILSLITSIFLKKEGDGFNEAMNEIKEN
ncbi:MAG: DUF4199 domain-containing protein [Bacteroidales bacterium]|nr:DUF4199 domain-containing protein [Bacteroidales bacterium]MCF8458875.1 DUF4199 domain-containing protein [Bacteroidales bacterium]